MNGADFVGYLATLIIAWALLPQFIKSWRTKSTKDISLLWSSVYSVGLALWLVYGILILNWPLIISSAIEFALASSLLVLKIRYG
jgi:MtN3 and saliva related transmembrane protein